MLDGDLLVTSSYLTYQKWSGFLGCLAHNEIIIKDDDDNKKSSSSSSITSQPLKLGLGGGSGLTFECGLVDAKWTSNTHVLVAKDNGEIALLNVINVNEQQDSSSYSSSSSSSPPKMVYNQKMAKMEHDSMVLCIETRHEAQLALSGSYDATYLRYFTLFYFILFIRLNL